MPLKKPFYPKEEDMIRKGLKGGSYKPLSDKDIEKIHHSSLKVLGEVGVEINDEGAVQLAKNKGAIVNEDRKTVKFPPGLVMDFIHKAPSQVKLCGREEKHDLTLEGKRVYLGTGGTALNVLDLDSGKRRQTILKDLRNIAKLVDALDNIHFFLLPTYPSEIPTERVDVNRFFAGLSNTTKHIMGGVYTRKGVKDVIRMAEIIAGSPKKLRERPIISMITCAMSPLKQDGHYCRLMMEIARAGIPLVCPSEPLSGATAPITLAGTLVIQNVDTLVGVIITQIVNPGTPVICGSVATSTDLRDMKYLAGSIESGLINAAAAQMAQYYKLPYYATAGMSDSKIPDAQSGYESAMTALLAALAGANYIHDAAGLLEFALTVSYEKYVIDNEILGMVMRAVDGIEVNENTIAYELIKKVGPGGNFLAESHTVGHMRKEHYQPNLSDRNRREEWENQGAKDTLNRAREKVQKILSSHRPLPLSGEALERIEGEISGIVYE